MIHLVWAQGQDGEMGYKGDLPWILPNDMRHFKRLTTGKTVVMGRRTFESIGCPLKGRYNVILSRHKKLYIPGVMVVNSPTELIEIADGKDLYVIGGAEIYRRFMPYADWLHITLIHDKFEADTFAPYVSLDQFKIIKATLNFADEENPYNHTFLTLARTNWAN